MHELAVCQALLRQVSDIAADRGAAAVEQIIVSIGPLSGVEPALLASAFTVARLGTVAAGADLLLDTGPVVVECHKCGQRSEVQANRLLCGQCGGWQVMVREGEELLLVRVNLSMPDAGVVKATGQRTAGRNGADQHV
jgi:hydrogenase nickel incorporation protein HypA/HybF